jgi:hypothetical protein
MAADGRSFGISLGINFAILTGCILFFGEPYLVVIIFQHGIMFAIDYYVERNEIGVLL